VTIFINWNCERKWTYAIKNSVLAIDYRNTSLSDTKSDWPMQPAYLSIT